MRRRKARQRMVALPPPATATGGGPTQYEKPAGQPESYQPYPGGGSEYNPNQPNNANHGSAGPQFPEPAYHAGSEYAPPSGPPPSATYAPPAGPPPGK
ncbi:hypothetical protein FRC09_016538 [Ceratobasidium sp. 395]|nr:hypothetical protein FRC09_016538 [Ceratobasidium sp. 395]